MLVNKVLYQQLNNQYNGHHDSARSLSNLSGRHNITIRIMVHDDSLATQRRIALATDRNMKRRPRGSTRNNSMRRSRHSRQRHATIASHRGQGRRARRRARPNARARSTRYHADPQRSTSRQFRRPRISTSSNSILRHRPLVTRFIRHNLHLIMNKMAHRGQTILRLLRQVSIQRNAPSQTLE